MSKKLDGLDALLDATVNYGRGCQSCKRYPPGTDVYEAFKRWRYRVNLPLGHKDHADTPVSMLWSLYLKPKLGYTLSVESARRHAKLCLGGD